MITALGPEDRAELAVAGKLEMTCDYCNALYLFATEGQPIDAD